MVNKFKYFFSKLSGEDSILGNSIEGSELGMPETTFILKYGDIEVGRLISKDNTWKFFYTDNFKDQSEIVEIADFPKKNKEYEKSYLWPFFASRLPSLEQPKIKEIIKAENIDKNNKAALLGRFGERSINNSYTLVEA